MDAPTTIEALKPAMELRGKVTNIELYGAFVDIGIGQDALLHISQLGQNKVRNVEDVVKVGDEITVYVLKVDKANNRIALSLVKPPEVSWDSLEVGATVEGEVVRVENFGAFVEIGAERPGMVHVSEMADGYVKSPSDVVKVGDKVQARVLKINKKKRQIDLTMKSEEEAVDMDAINEEDEELPTAMAVALRRAMESNQDDDDRTRRSRSNKRRDNSQQDDILSRTLRDHSNN